MPCDDFTYLTAEIGVAHIAHAFSVEDRVGEAVHGFRGRLTQLADLVWWQAETQADTQFAEK